MLLAPTGRLSKRHGSVSIIEYKEQGYLPEAMVNFLSLRVGRWTVNRIDDRQGNYQDFTLGRVTLTGAIFNVEKLDWMNGYISATLGGRFFKRVILFLERDLPQEVKRPVSEYVKIAPLVQERVKKLNEISELTDSFYG